MSEQNTTGRRAGSAIHHRQDGSWFLSGLVIRDAMDDPTLANRILVDLLGIALAAPESGVALRAATFVPFTDAPPPPAR